MKYLFRVLAASLVTLCLMAQDDTQYRVHSKILAEDGETVLYYLTTINRDGELESETVFLLKDAETEQQFVLTSSALYNKAQSVFRIYHPDSKQEIRYQSDLGFEGRTRSAVLAEFRAMSKDELRDMRGSGEIVVAGVRHPGDADKWRNPAIARQFRTELRARLNPSVIEGLERMRIVATRETRLNPFCDILSTVLYNVKCDEGKVSNVVVAADCSYDASFGYGCDPQQRRRVEQAARDGEPLLRY